MKDQKLLLAVSKLFTEETLKETLKKTFQAEYEIEIVGWHFGEASAKGDSYLSTVNRVTIDAKVGGKDIQLKIVVKSLPTNLGRRKTFRSSDFFYNEIIFYTKIIPVLEQFLNAKDLAKVLLVPKCLAYVLDGENDFIVLEDVSVRGFGPASRQSALNLAEFQMILKAMARFHAVSFAFKDQHETEFYAVADQLKETYFSNEHENWYRNFHSVLVTIAKDAMAKEFGGTDEAEKFIKIDREKFWKKSVEICGRSKSKTSIINQGDAWAPNFLMRKDESTGKVEALLLDFQLTRCAGPVSDLSFFIYSCSDKNIRDEHFNDLLEFYYNELAKTIKLLDTDPDKIYPRSLFYEEVQNEFIHGLNFSFESVPFSMLDSSESFDLDTVEGDEAVDIAKIWALKPIENREKRKRLADIIMHAYKKNLIPF